MEYDGLPGGLHEAPPVSIMIAFLCGEVKL